jgi:hypothetical protein
LHRTIFENPIALNFLSVRILRALKCLFTYSAIYWMSFFCLSLAVCWSRAARFFLVQNTKTLNILYHH